MELLRELFEAAEEKKKESLPPVDAIAMLLFKKKSGPVKDLKRSKEAEFEGVANERSLILGSDGKGLRLTFDNSTDSGEFEIDSITPLQVVQGSDLDKTIKKLYSKYDVSSKKRIGYITKGDKVLVREIHLGKELTTKTVKLVAELISLLKNRED